ncbi:CLUMA_CG007876, isoform A [Clunio marinus]|uniref:CLUMA_CG007876, isoform A n=1 Tax=Clunio marinus TaxID=568069 RepID=A0A1J1I3M5_9DIPT|nr:CLUMA_CG007876, isoform A [Clunio marinus]
MKSLDDLCTELNDHPIKMIEHNRLKSQPSHSFGNHQYDKDTPSLTDGNRHHEHHLSFILRHTITFISLTRTRIAL